jgi:glutaredoxin 3
MSPRVTVYSTAYCYYCVRAKALLEERGIPYRLIDVTGDAEARRALVQASEGRRTVPQVFIDGVPIGGWRELSELDRRGGLAGLDRPSGGGEGSTARGAG